MKYKNNSFIKQTGVALACAIIAACSADDVSVPPLNSGPADAGDADFTTYVAVGDSLTAGYADGALYKSGQMNSFPNILAGQFADVGGGAFEQPLAETDLGGFLVGGQEGILENRFVLNTQTETPERLEGTPTEEVTASGLNGNTYNNMGVPGAKSYHLIAGGYGEAAGLLAPTPTANPFFVRFSMDPASTTETVIADAAGQSPTFFTLWIGNNDVLSYATSGGIGATACVPPACGENDITDPTAFAGIYTTAILPALTANPATKGVLVNIPDVKSIPFFTTVPYNAIPLDQATADMLNQSYAPYNDGLQAAVGQVPGFTQEEADARQIVF
ncbi:MAG TPA: G-D-S-L family lipolytic protein, partial [Gammaproteobacteria bacterium]|nr:G-D-S-L family lipolytic protein [Gammaproteobacteria bacterium]